MKPIVFLVLAPILWALCFVLWVWWARGLWRTLFVVCVACSACGVFIAALLEVFS